MLESARYKKLLSSWGAFLKRPVPQRPRARNARRDIEEFAAARVWRLHKRILRDGGVIEDDTPDEQVHDLRLVAKKLRYMMEFSRTLFDADRIGAQIKTLKRLAGLPRRVQRPRRPPGRRREVRDGLDDRGRRRARHR